MATSTVRKEPTVANNLTTTAEGYVLDARQGKALADALVKRETKSLTFSNGVADLTFSRNVQVISVTGVTDSAQFGFYRNSGMTGYKVRCYSNTSLSGSKSMDVTYFNV